MHLNNNLPEPMRSIVILHEIGHHMLHKDIAKSFKEFNIFDPTGNIMEYEANPFAAQVMLPDNDTVELIKQGYSVTHIAASLNTDPNLVALKATELERRGMALNILDFKKNFL